MERAGSREGVLSTQDPLSIYPREVATRILCYVPPYELLKVCMLVSRSWRELLGDPLFWKHRLRQSKNYSLDLDRIENIDWLKLCFYIIQRPNLVKSFDKGALSFKSWKLSSHNWESFKLSSVDLEDGRGGGDGWDIETEISPVLHKDLVSENHGSTSNYVTSYGWCCREQVIELAKFGFIDDIMDISQPVIVVSEWFCARWDCGSIFNIHVELLGRKKEVIDTFEHSEVTEQWLGGDLGWRKVEHKFSGYGPGVRYVRFADAGKDTQFWAGHYGSKMAAACTKLYFHE